MREMHVSGNVRQMARVELALRVLDPSRGHRPLCRRVHVLVEPVLFEADEVRLSDEGEQKEARHREREPLAPAGVLDDDVPELLLRAWPRTLFLLDTVPKPTLRRVPHMAPFHTWSPSTNGNLHAVSRLEEHQQALAQV